MKKLITLNEQDLYRLVESSINNIIMEGYWNHPSIDWNTVDTITFECSYDEDDLKEAIEDGDIDNSDEGIEKWMYENLEFSILCQDNDGNNLGWLDTTPDMMSYDGIPQEYIDLIVDEYKKDPKINHEYRIDDISYEMASRIDDVDEACKRMFDTADEYQRGMHGFVLKDGTIILMPPGGDHNNITSINGVESKWQFVEDGYPSIVGNNLRVGGELTYPQKEVIGRMIRSYSDEELYVSFLGGKHGEQSCRYYQPDWRAVMADIERYYTEGIIPQGDGF